MRKARRFGGVWAYGSMLAMAACGAASKEPPPAQSPQAPQAGYGQPPAAESATKKAEEARRPIDMGASSPGNPVPGAAPEPPPAAAPPAEPAPAAPSATDPRARYAQANVQLSDARRQLDIAAGQRDCANACRALDSMERAAGQICELARSTEERRTCRAAEDQVGSARERVRNACGECPKKR